MKGCTIPGVLILLLATGLVSCSLDGGGSTGSDIGSPAPYIYTIPKTGQTASLAAGDDGDLQTGLSWPDPRFAVDGETIVDNLTGLMWEQAPSTDLMTWTEAVDHAADLDAGGYGDWRLPNVLELESLLRHSGEVGLNNYLHDQGFADSMTMDVWWSSTSSTSLLSAWYVSVYGPMFKMDESSSASVICVRGTSPLLPKTGMTVSAVSGDDGDLRNGWEWPDPRFTDNGDGTITDELTRLMWQKSPSTEELSWADALSAAAARDEGGHSDWRMPNIRELLSLVHYGAASQLGWLDEAGFENIIDAGCWSSTSQPGVSNRAYILNVNGGTVHYRIKTTDEQPCIAVRNAG